MVCPECGANGAALGGACPQCGKTLSRNRVAAATLTPPATSPIPPVDEAETRLASDPGGFAARPPGAPLGALAPGDLFGPRYRILRVLGAGGMGIVYHAWDEELGIAVALKVIRPEVSADPAMAKELEKRFKRELLLARQVTHHNVVRIHDIGEVERTKYITMSFIDGRDLATELKAAGHLTVPKTLLLIRQLAEGLQAAHGAGVIHRDLKPANIMVEGDTVMIMDFGIARSAVRPVEGNVRQGTMPLSRSALVTGATMQGAIVGTVAYMSPEQAKGQPADQRSDLYAVGMIMRDMLVGMREVENPTDALNELMARVEHAPKPVLEIDPSIPPDVDRIVTRCLQPDAAARYQNVQELIADLSSLDAEGKPLPKIRPLTKRLVYAAGVVVLTLLLGTWWLARTQAPPVQPPAMSVLVADVENSTGDALFDGSLEPTLAIAMEGASFINAYRRDDARKLAGQMSLGSKLDEKVAQLVSLREGINVILASSIATRGDGYVVSLRAIDPSDGKVLATTSRQAESKDDVLKAVTYVASVIRNELGDTTPQSASVAALETVTAGSLDALRDYSRGQDLLYQSRDEEAIVYYKQAIAEDPNLGRAYSGWAISAQNLGRRDEALDAWKKAVSLVDRMTERERLRTLGNYYIAVPRNYDKAVESLSLLVKLYPYDRGGHVNIAIAYFYKRDFAKALEHGRRSVEIAPKDVINRANLALYAMYAGDFDTAAAEATEVLKLDQTAYRSYLPIAIAAIAKSDFDGAQTAYDTMGRTGPPGASLANLGLADLRLYQGRSREAIALLTSGIAADEKHRNTGGMAAKFTALADAYLAEGRSKLAVEAARRAIKLLGSTSASVPAARVLIAAGQPQEARALAATFAENLQPELRAYAKLLEGELALRERRLVTASEAFLAGQKLADLWWARLGLGVAYIEADHAAEALGELELCQKRRGEATAMLLDDLPSIRYLAPLPYWLARAQEGVGQRASAVSNYNAYLALRPDAPKDPLAADATRRIAGGTGTRP